MRILCSAILVALYLAGAPKAIAQDITFFFAAGDFSGKPDRFGNTYSVGPASAIDPRPFGNEELLDVFFDEDNKWLIYEVAGNKMLVSHAPGGLEDGHELIAGRVVVAQEMQFEAALGAQLANQIAAANTRCDTRTD